MVEKMCSGARDSLRIMQITRWRTLVSLGSLLLVLGTPLDAQAVPAFPGCEGFGCETTGGRGGADLYGHESKFHRCRQFL